MKSLNLNLDKGISTLTGILIVLVVALIAGGIFYWQWLGIKEEGRGQEEVVTPLEKPIAEFQPEESVDTSGWKTYRNKEGGYEVKYLISSGLVGKPKNILVYSKLITELENPGAPESTYNRPIKLILEIFKMDISSGRSQKFIEIQQSKRQASRSIFAERHGNYIIVFGLGKTAQKEEIFDLSGKLLKDFKFPPNFDSNTPLVFTQDNEFYAYNILHEYVGEDTEKINKEEWGAVVVRNREGKEIMKLSLEEFKMKTRAQDYFNRFNRFFGYPRPVGFKDHQNLYLSLQVDYPGPIPGYLFILNLKTKEIKEITAIRRKKLSYRWEYLLNPQIGLAYGMKKGYIGIEGEPDGPPTELFIISLDKDEYKVIAREEELVAGSYMMDKEGKYLVFNFAQLIGREYPVVKKLAVRLYNLRTREIKTINQLDRDVVLRGILNNGKLILYSDAPSRELYLFNILTDKKKKILSKGYDYIGVWEEI